MDKQEAKKDLKIDLRQMILALEKVVDLVGINDVNHGKRVGYIATQIAYNMEYDKDDIQFLFELGLMHDCGVSSDTIHMNLVKYFNWDEDKEHCIIGHGLLEGFAPLRKFAIPILHHHTPWEELKTLDLDPKIKDFANLIFLADRIDVKGALHYGKDILIARDDIKNFTISQKETFFKPELVDVFVEMSKSEALWLALEDRHITRYVWDMNYMQESQTLNLDELEQFAQIFAYIVDQKSAFTAEHSINVSKLCAHIAKLAKLDEITIRKLGVAGLLHDIGKLRIPDGILDKPGALTKLERSIINQHSYETYEILRDVNGIEDIAMWAAYHHDEPNGAGYPFHPSSDELGIEARIVSVADVFQALAQDRPYRKGMTLFKILEVLREFAKQGKLDKDLVKLVIENKESCFLAAKAC